MRGTLLLVLVLVGSGSAPIAGTAELEAKLLPDDGGQFESFGASVDLDGDTAIAGATGHNHELFDNGAAYTFVRVGDTWVQEDEFQLPDPNVHFGDQFGARVAIDGDTAVASSIGYDENGDDSGAVFVFTRTAGVWTAVAILLADDGASEDGFGFGLAIDGGTVLVGAAGNDDAGPSSGSAYVFTGSGSSWTQQAKLVADDAAATAFFGREVALDGDTAIVSAHGDDELGLNSGAAYVFTRTAGVWSQQAKLLGEDSTWGDGLGLDVAVDGDTVLVGATGADGTGAAYAFVRDGGLWTQQAKLLAADGMTGDHFGFAIDLDGDTAVITNDFDTDNGTNAGSAYIFTRIDGSWSEQVKLLAPDGEAGDALGLSAAIDGETVLVGALGDDDQGDNAGAAYLFRFVDIPDDDPDDVPAVGGFGLLLLVLSMATTAAWFVRRRESA